MFDFSISEMLVVVVVILIAIGPRDLPRALHTVGRWVSRARAMASEFHRHIDDMVHEVELEEFHRKSEDLNRKSLTQMLENVVDSDGKIRRGLELPDFDASDLNKEGTIKNKTPLQQQPSPSCSPLQSPPTSSVTLEGDHAPEPR
ncbi:Twin-arginine translocation protein TatB [invertebrate metagenome]|uniref:Twin-arginine translocation protein TatB n=1 Tax=invertebrate metagenome TaxID=1711999 RepID=A0A484H4P2_9ZZZZ